MPPINGPQNSNVLPPPPRTSQPYSPANPYSAHSQYADSIRQNIAVNTSSIAFVSQPSQEIQHRPMIPSNQMPPIAKNPTSVSAPSMDTVKLEPAKINQSYQWATNSPPTNIPQGTIGVPEVSSSIDKTSQVSTDQTAESQTSFTRVNKILTYDQGHPIPPSASNVNLPPSNITQHLNQNSYVQQEPVSSSVSSRTQNIQAQPIISPSESLSSPFRYGSQQNISSASSMPNSSTQNVFYSAQGHNIGPQNPHNYNPQPLKPQQNLLTGYMDPMGLGSIPQDQNIHQNLAGQRKYPQQDTANTAMLPPSGGNQLHGARLPPLGMPPLPGQQTVMESKNITFAYNRIKFYLINFLFFLQKVM